MTVTRVQNGTSVTLKPQGRIDTTTSPLFEAEIKQLAGVTELILDFEKVEYISSAGLRVIVAAARIMDRQGTMKLVKVSSEVMEILDITGFTDIFTIE